MKFIEILDKENVKHLLSIDCIMFIATYDNHCSISMCYNRNNRHSNEILVSLESGQELIKSLKSLND